MDFPIIELSEIPDIDLYMDQVTTFIENRLNCLKRFEKDKILTKTMINNYAKDKILLPPVKKKYSKNHIILLILIYHLKSILSIYDIGKLLAPINAQLENGDSYGLEIIYKCFTALQKNEFTACEQFISKEITDDVKNKIELFVSVLKHVIDANTQKRSAERILDNNF